MINKKIYHAAIYVRLSKEDGNVANAAKDDGYSGSNFDRPAFDETNRNNMLITP